MPKERHSNEIKLWAPEEIWCKKRGTGVIACGKIYYKRLWKNIRYPLGKINEDEFTTHKILFECNKIALIENTLYFYRQTPGSIMRTQWTPQRLDGIAALKEQYHFFLNIGANLAVLTTKKEYTHVIYMNLRGARKAKADKNLCNNLKQMLKENINKLGTDIGISVFKHPDYYRELYPFFAPVFDLLILFHALKDGGISNTAERIKMKLLRIIANLKCRKYQ